MDLSFYKRINLCLTHAYNFILKEPKVIHHPLAFFYFQNDLITQTFSFPPEPQFMSQGTSATKICVFLLEHSSFNVSNYYYNF